MNTYGRLATTSTLVSTITSTATSMVATGGWSLASTPLLLYIGGELVRATAAASAGGGNVTFTVQRSLNGVVKAHTAGAEITLAEPFRLALGPRSGPGLIVPPAPSLLYPTTAALVAAELGPAGQVVAWMPHAVSADTRIGTDWAQGQGPDHSPRPDGTDPQSIWYPNTDALAGPYGRTDYMFRADTAQAFSGTGYLETVLKNPYASSFASQIWKFYGQDGNPFPAGLWWSWRMRFHEVITYDNTDGSGHDGFTNHVQWYRKAPGDEPIITFGAGRNLTNDSVMRWHLDLQQWGQYDIAVVADPAIPIGSWIHMEAYVLIDVSGAGGGRILIWQDGQLIRDFTGSVMTDAWTRYGWSVGSYGSLMHQNPITIDYDEVLISTVPTHDRLILPSPAGGNG